MSRVEVYDANGLVEVLYLDVPIEDARADLRAAIRSEATNRIEALWPDWRQRSAALGVYGEAGRQACAAWIAAHRQAVDDADVLIAAAQGHEQLSMVAVAWPEPAT